MLKKKMMATSLATLVLAISMFTPTNVFAAEVENSSKAFEVPNTARLLWLAPGEHTQYPNEGGTWTYGFWNAKVRSYYTVNRCHGSTVVYNGNKSRSADTASGKKSIAEKWAVNWPTNDDEYYYRVCD